MDVTQLLPLVEQYREAQQRIEAAQNEMESLRKQLMLELTVRNTDRLNVGSHRVTMQTITTHRLDSKALKATSPELAARFTITTTGSRLVIN